MEKEIKVYPLKYPVTVGERTCTELRFSRPKMKDLIAIGASPLETADALAKLVSSITGEPLLIIEQLDIEDSAYVKIEAERIFSTYFFTTPYELNPTPPPAKTGETAEANSSPSAKSETG
jgi:hypothetical protein